MRNSEYKTGSSRERQSITEHGLCMISICIVYYMILWIVSSAAHDSYAKTWDSVILDEAIQIDKITPSRDGVYFLSKPIEGSGTDEAKRNLAYWRFQDQKYSYLSIGNNWKFLDCELTREGYLAVGCGPARIEFFSKEALMPDFGGGAFIDHGLNFMDLVVTGEHALAFIYYEGAYRVSGEKYNILEKMPSNSRDWFLCNGHNGTIWAALRWLEIPEVLIERIDQKTVTRQIRMEGGFRGFYSDSADTLWIATSTGLYRIPSDVSLEAQSHFYNPGPPVYPKELTLCSGYPGPPPTSVVCDATGRTIVGTENDGLFLYEGKIWAHITLADGIAGMSIRCVGVDPDNRFFAAGNGWFSHEKDVRVGVVEQENRPIPLTIYPPYPNPANPTVTISYTLHHNSPVHLSLFNSLGQKVFDFSKQYVTAGFHQHNFTTSDLASGLYLVRVEADGYYSFAKVTIMK